MSGDSKQARAFRRGCHVRVTQVESVDQKLEEFGETHPRMSAASTRARDLQRVCQLTSIQVESVDQNTSKEIILEKFGEIHPRMSGASIRARVFGRGCQIRFNTCNLKANGTFGGLDFAHCFAAVQGPSRKGILCVSGIGRLCCCADNCFVLVHI